MAFGAMLIVAVAARWSLAAIVPGFLWNNDSPSYASAAWKWLAGGPWETSEVRGPIYASFIAATLRLGGDFATIVFLQHALGVVAIGLGGLVLRQYFGPRAFLPLLICGYAYAVYPEPICREHYIANEALLFFCASIALASWFWALEQRRPAWLWLTGASLGLLTLIKNVYLPLPIVVVLGQLYLHRTNLRSSMLSLAVFLAALALPFLGVRVQKHFANDRIVSAPQDGLLIYGRTAQFTVLDGGIEPEIKALIRPDIEAYRQLPKLENNIILHDTAVPRLAAHLRSRGQTPRDLNRLCWRLALEAIRAHPREYLRQVFGDLDELHFKHGSNRPRPGWKEVRTTVSLFSGRREPQPGVQPERIVERLTPRANKENFRGYESLTSTSWLFAVTPVLLTSLLLPLFTATQKGVRRIWWMGLLTVWVFNIGVLSTVGRPLERYITPVVPIMFWALAGTVICSWIWLSEFWERHTAKIALPDGPEALSHSAPKPA